MLCVDSNTFSVYSKAHNGICCVLRIGKDHNCISFIFKVSQCSGERESSKEELQNAESELRCWTWVLTCTVVRPQGFPFYLAGTLFPLCFPQNQRRFLSSFSASTSCAAKDYMFPSLNFNV